MILIVIILIEAPEADMGKGVVVAVVLSVVLASWLSGVWEMEFYRDVAPKLMFVVSGGAGLLGLFLALLYYYQDQLLYFPDIPHGSRWTFVEPDGYIRKNAFEEV